MKEKEKWQSVLSWSAKEESVSGRMKGLYLLDMARSKTEGIKYKHTWILALDSFLEDFCLGSIKRDSGTYCSDRFIGQRTRATFLWGFPRLS
jgi:hypothetical protein